MLDWTSLHYGTFTSILFQKFGYIYIESIYVHIYIYIYTYVCIYIYIYTYIITIIISKKYGIWKGIFIEIIFGACTVFKVRVFLISSLAHIPVFSLEGRMGGFPLSREIRCPPLKSKILCQLIIFLRWTLKNQLQQLNSPEENLSRNCLSISRNWIIKKKCKKNLKISCL